MGEWKKEENCSCLGNPQRPRRSWRTFSCDSEACSDLAYVRRLLPRRAEPQSRNDSSSLTSSLRPSQRTSPHATARYRLCNTLRPSSHRKQTLAIDHGGRATLPFPQATMAQQREHAHRRRLPGRWSCTLSVFIFTISYVLTIAPHSSRSHSSS